MTSPKNSLLAALLALACLNGCAGASLRKGGLKAAASPMQSKFRDLDLKQRQQIFESHRLTWNGRYLEGNRDTLDTASLVKFLEESGASDLAVLASKTEPAFIRPESKEPRKKDRPAAQYSFQEPINQNWVGTLPNDDKLAAFVMATAAAGAAVYGTVVAVKSIVEGVWSDLNPNPTLEDILEAYNQRLAFALGLNFDDVSLYTSAPRPSNKPAQIARDQRHGAFAVRAGIGASLIGMGLASAARFYSYSQSQSAPEWTDATFYASTGALLANLILGWTVVW